jgi:signal transduction histidine kinase
LNLKIRVSGDDISPRPDSFVEGTLFRIAQEALTNAAKYASASEVTISIEQCPSDLRVTVRDDGIGFQLGAIDEGRSNWGLKNMHERAQAIGAELLMSSVPGTGTSISVVVSRRPA